MSRRSPTHEDATRAGNDHRPPGGRSCCSARTTSCALMVVGAQKRDEPIAVRAGGVRPGPLVKTSTAGVTAHRHVVKAYAVCARPPGRQLHHDYFCVKGSWRVSV